MARLYNVHVDIPAQVLELAKTIRGRGGRALLVGGCVRDELMGEQPKDWDLEVYGIDPAELRRLLDQMGNVNVVGEAFTVYKLGPGLDVSIPRRERKSGRGHRAFVIEGDPAMAVAEATARRDFTINAILQDPLTEEIIDPFRGRDDLAARVLRAVSPETFVEDSLRVLRAAQFAARFEFEIETQTIALCRSIALDDLPAERIWGEMEKILLRATRPSIGLRWLRELGPVHQLFPELQALIDVPQEPEWHPEGDVWIHTLLTTNRARDSIGDLDYPRQATVMLAALCHDLGKPATTAFVNGRIRSREHEEGGVQPTIDFLNRLNIHTLDGYDVRAQVIALVRNHLKPGEFFKKRDEVGDGAFRRLARKCELELLFRVARADSLGRNADWVPREQWFTAEAQDWFIERARDLEVTSRPPEPILLGRHVLELGLPPGPRVGDITKAVYEMQLDGRVTTLDDAQTAVRKILSADYAEGNDS
jgi:tRNA nucleotidyltransferase (CCA-adding enzyme)